MNLVPPRHVNWISPRQRATGTKLPEFSLRGLFGFAWVRDLIGPGA